MLLFQAPSSEMMMMNNENLPPVVNQNETTPFFKNKKNLIILGIIIVIMVVNTVIQIKDAINEQKRQQTEQIQAEQTQPTQTKEPRIPVDLVYTIKVGYHIDYVNNAFQNYKPRIDDTLNDKKGIRAYDIVDGNIFVITYKLSDGLIDHLEIANGLTKKPMNVQSLPGYPLLTKEQVDALPEDWEPYL